MMDVEMLKRQHREIRDVVNSIKEFIDKGNVKEDAMEVAKNINLLSGKVKIHLSTEDRFMYPNLLKYSSIEMQETAQQYIDEMGSIYEEFEKYKICYNTRSKIVSDVEGFIEETVKILDVIEHRMTKEDRKLYPLIPNYMQDPLGITK